MILNSSDSTIVGVMKPMIEHSTEWMGCFPREQFWKQMLVGHCSGNLIYTILYVDKNAKNRFEERMMSVR